MHLSYTIGRFESDGFIKTSSLRRGKSVHLSRCGAKPTRAPVRPVPKPVTVFLLVLCPHLHCARARTVFVGVVVLVQSIIFLDKIYLVLFKFWSTL